MPIKTPSFSSLVVSSEGTSVVKTDAVRSAGPLSGKTRSARPRPDKTKSAKKPEIKKLESTTTLYDKINTVYEFDSTFYDTEITGSGVTSAYPVILGTLPFKNFYQSGDLTNIGYLYDIQNELRDVSIAKANELVEKYLTSTPAASASLSLLTEENINKYDTLVRNIPKIFRLKEDLINSTEISVPLENQISKIDSLSSTTSADAAPPSLSIERSVSTAVSTTATTPSIGSDATVTSSSPALSTTSTSTSGTGGNISVEYNDDDIQIEDITKLTERLLGPNRPNQQKTTRQYQLLKAALAQCFEGKNFSNVEDDRFYDSPYRSLERNAISPIYSVTSKDMQPEQGYYFAKSTLEKAASIIDNDYLPTANFPNGSAFLVDMSASGLFYVGNINKVSAGVYQIASGSKEGNFLNKSTNLFESSKAIKSLPVLSLRNDYYTADFIKQIIPVLSSEITDTLEGIPTLPASIDPYEKNSIDVTETSNNDIRFISRTLSDQSIYLFDNDITNTTNNITSITSILALNIDQIAALKSDIDALNLSFERFANTNRQRISNQRSLTIASIFYQNLYDFFTTSILGSDTQSFYSAIRTVMFARACVDAGSAARLYRIIYDNDKEITNMIARGDSYELPELYTAQQFINWMLFGSGTGKEGCLITGTTEDNNVPLKIGKDVLSTNLTSYPDLDDKYVVRSDDPTTFIKSLYSEVGTFKTVCLKAINDILKCYPEIKNNTKLVSKIRLGFFSMLIYCLKNLMIRGESIIDFSSDPSLKVKLKWQKESALFIADCLKSVIKNVSVNDISFTNFEKFTGSSPTDKQLRAGSDAFFKPLRAPIKYSLQISQDIKTLLSYQTTIFKAQSNALSSMMISIDYVVGIYNGNKQKAYKIISRYSSLESVVELLYQAERDTNFIPGTLISKNATRSENYRSIVKMAFKNYIPKKDNLMLCIVGIPYGHLERLRLGKNERTYYYGCNLFGDRSEDYDETQNPIEYDFLYKAVSSTERPNVKGPYSSLISNLYDDFDSTRIVENMQDGKISIMKLNDEGNRLDVLTRGEANPKTQSIDFPASIVQSALQAYVEDVYGFYPRKVGTKGTLGESFPEMRYADEVLKFNNITQKSDEQRLIYSRLKSVIMMHRLFMTTRMIEQIEAASIFDKIHFSLVDGNKFEDVITEFYANLEI